MSDVMVEAGIDGAGAETVEERAGGEEEPKIRGGVAKSTESDEGTAEGEECSDAEGAEEASAEKAGEKIGEAGTEEDERDGALGEIEMVANTRPGDADERVRKAEADETEIGDEEEKRPAFGVVSFPVQDFPEEHARIDSGADQLASDCGR